MKTICIILLSAGLTVFFIFSKDKTIEYSSAATVPSFVVFKTDSALHLINGVYYYGKELFSGTMKDAYANGSTHHKVSFYKGKEEGWSFMYYEDGLVAEKRYYHLGEKDGVHTGWWPNGKPRFEYHFNNGVYNGDYKEWYVSGQAYKNIHYVNGTDENGKGWRENGKLFMNYTMVNGRRYGIVNSNLCYTLKNERGEFTGTKPTVSENDAAVNTGSKQR